MNMTRTRKLVALAKKVLQRKQGAVAVLDDNGIAEEVAQYRAEESALKSAIYEKSQLYFGVALLAIISYVVAAFGPGWIRWIAGFSIAGLLVGQFGMLSLLRQLQQFYAPLRNDFVVRNHLLMGAAALLALVYALLGLWGRWPVPWLAMAFAITINLLHGFGYTPKEKHG